MILLLNRYDYNVLLNKKLKICYPPQKKKKKKKKYWTMYVVPPFDPSECHRASLVWRINIGSGTGMVPSGKKKHFLSQCWSRTILQYGIVMLQCGIVTPYGDIELNIVSGNNVGVNSDSAIPIPIPAKLKFTIPIPIPWIAIAILFLSQYVNPWKLETHGCIFSCHCGYRFPGTKHQTCSSHSAH